MATTSQNSPIQSYQIRSESIKTFVEDRNIKLPRFQRKQTWDEKKNFALAISVFKGFPLGVVVVNKEVENRKPLKWLLDGRQRRHALTTMLEDPEALYVWARKFVGFKQSDSEQEIDEKYWKKIEDYLGKDDSDDKAEAPDDIPPSDLPGDEEPSLAEDNDQEQTQPIVLKHVPEISRYQDLDLLRDLILLSYPKKAKHSGFTRPFDFGIDNLDYIDVDDGDKHLNSKKLRNWMYECRRWCSNQKAGELNKDTFYSYLKKLNKKDDPKLKNKVEREWERIQKRFEGLDTIENKLREAQLGLIELTGANASDAQTTFKIINSSGTPLNAVEILSAKPSWNETISNPSPELANATKKLYGAIDVDDVEGVVHWDAPATFAARLTRLGFILSSLDYAKSEQLAKSITLGFKIVSAIYEKGISKDHIDLLSTNKKINWQTDTETVVKDFNQIGKILSEDNFFAFFASWKISLMDLASDAIAIDFLIRVYLDWKRKDEPSGAGAQTKVFLKNARILFDSLIFEYLTRQWRGSSDARVAEHIRKFDAEPELYKPRSRTEWEKLIEEIIDHHSIGTIRLKTENVDPLLKPILYYHYVLLQLRGPEGIDVSLEVDHIIPQSSFEPSNLKGKEFKTHNLFNLALLPKRENISKGDKLLKHLPDDPWLKDQVSRYTSISQKDFERFSNVHSIDELKTKRKKVFKEAFGDKRDSVIV
jgi:hypothetical protein